MVVMEVLEEVLEMVQAQQQVVDQVLQDKVIMVADNQPQVVLEVAVAVAALVLQAVLEL
jgi:hypothetical protein